MRKSIYAICAFVLFLLTTQVSAIPISGSVSGVFENPLGGSALVTTGVGTNHFTFGNNIPSEFIFNGASSFNTPTDVFFDIGTLTFFNGTSSSLTLPTSVELDITLDITNPVGVTESLPYKLNLFSTVNWGATPEANADIVYFPTTLPETNFLIDNAVYSLALEVGVSDANGFTSQNSFSVYEGATAIATIRGKIATISVPEPPMVFLFALMAVGLLVNHKKKQA